jgi:hypothetical protein
MTREELIEVMARAMLADELTVRPTLTFDPAWQQESDIWLSNAKAALAALEAAGVRLVPVHQTDAMWDAGANECGEDSGTLEIYRAMLAASPYAPQKDTGNG